VEIAAQGHEPHRVAFYLYDLASEFPRALEPGQRRAASALHPGRGRGHDPAKLALIRAVAIVISNGLGILGVKPVEKM
jgi:arginyl-tRNA synthetase